MLLEMGGEGGQPSREGVGTARHTQGSWPGEGLESVPGRGNSLGWLPSLGTCMCMGMHACASTNVHVCMRVVCMDGCMLRGGCQVQTSSLTNTLFTTCLPPLLPALPRVYPNESLLLNGRRVLWVAFSPYPLLRQIPPLCPSALQTSHR